MIATRGRSEARRPEGESLARSRRERRAEAHLPRVVDFPASLAAPTQGVFQAIADASIQQMEDYGELAGAVGKFVDELPPALKPMAAAPP